MWNSSKYSISLYGRRPQSNDLSRVNSALSLIKRVHIGAWFGYIACLTQWRGGGQFTCKNDFYLPSRRLEEGGGVSTLCNRPSVYLMVKAVALLREPRDGKGVGGRHEDQGSGNPQQYAASDIQVKNVCWWTVEEKQISIMIEVKQIFYHILSGILV